MGFFWFVVIGAAVGWYTGRSGKEGPFGPLGDIVVGIAGGLVGGFAAGIFGFSGTVGVIIAVIMSGAVAAGLVVRPSKFSRRNVHATVGARDKSGRLRRPS